MILGATKRPGLPDSGRRGARSPSGFDRHQLRGRGVVGPRVEVLAELFGRLAVAPLARVEVAEVYERAQLALGVEAEGLDERRLRLLAAVEFEVGDAEQQVGVGVVGPRGRGLFEILRRLLELAPLKLAVARAPQRRGVARV